MGGGRCSGRNGWLVLGFVGCEAIKAAREHFVNTEPCQFAIEDGRRGN